MKKLFFGVVMLGIMSFASNNLFAQSEKTVTEQAIGAVSEEASSELETNALATDDLESIATLLNNLVSGKKQNILATDQEVRVPIPKHGKINGHYVCQRLELSVLADKSETSKDKANKLLGGVLEGQSGSSGSDGKILGGLDGKTDGLGVGANFGYSLVFVPGHKEEGSDEILLNRFGFAYSVGLISQFDHEKNSGVTCDFLGKFGVETGFNKAIGVGLDFLFGGGKTAQTVLDFTYVNENDPRPEDLVVSSESIWCGKAGAQLWLRLNFLTASVNNFDTALFSRFVYSYRPYNNKSELNRMSTYNELPVWQHEAWSFGFAMTYFF